MQHVIYYSHFAHGYQLHKNIDYYEEKTRCLAALSACLVPIAPTFMIAIAMACLAPLDTRPETQTWDLDTAKSLAYLENAQMTIGTDYKLARAGNAREIIDHATQM